MCWLIEETARAFMSKSGQRVCMLISAAGGLLGFAYVARVIADNPALVWQAIDQHTRGHWGRLAAGWLVSSARLARRLFYFQ